MNHGGLTVMKSVPVEDPDVPTTIYDGDPGRSQATNDTSRFYLQEMAKKLLKFHRTWRHSVLLDHV